MLRSPNFSAAGESRGAWSPEEDAKLIAYITRYGVWNWQYIPKFAGLQRSGKSCRRRWINYLRPGIRRGPLSEDEKATIIRLQRDLGNRWSEIARRLPGRTGNEVRNIWYTHLRNTSSTLNQRNEQHQEDEASTVIRGNEQENAVVGLEADLIKIKEQLTGESHYLQCISIVGMGGIGKTTLAKAVFDDLLIQYHFYIRAWITVSQVYQLRELLLGILQNIGHLNDEIDTMTKEQLSEKLYRHLKGQRFLIVMDDMWSTEAWDYMRRSFPDDRNGSRILLTSRLTNLAAHVSPNHSPHRMRFLDKEQSWMLLHHRICLKQTYPPEFMDIGKKIAEKCKGLPLAILVVAGVLSDMVQACDGWRNVAENMNSVVTGDPEQYLGILAMSYNYLPHHLRPCFLYLCAFPEDCEIECWRLIRLWIAEGFVENKSSTSLEAVAEEYLEDLIDRSLISVGKRSCNGKIKTCGIHDLLRDLALRESRKQNFVQVMSKNVQLSAEGNTVLHRLSFHSGSFGKSQFEDSLRLMYSFLCFEVGFDMTKDICLCLSKFELLRVLDIGFVRFDNFPIVILELTELRFLALTAACQLPSSISELRNLQTFIVHGPWLSRKHGKPPTLPLEIWKMSQLRLLNLSAAICLGGPLQDEDDSSSSCVLKNLQTLCTIRSASCTEELFHSLPNLKKLGIRQIREDLDTHSGSSHFLNYLLHLHQLETLKCSFNVQNRETMRLPEWNAFPQRLKNLTLSSSYFPWTEMGTLGMLPNLEVLKLKNNAFEGPEWEQNENGFESLRVLLIEKTNLVHWKADRYSFPRLESIVLKFCEFLEEIPSEIADDMQLIELHYCSSSAESSAREIQEEQRSRDNDGLVIRIISKGQESTSKPRDS